MGQTALENQLRAQKKKVDIRAWSEPIRPQEPPLLFPPVLAIDDQRVGILADFQSHLPVASDLAVLQTPLGAIIRNLHATLQRIADPVATPRRGGREENVVPEQDS